MSLSVSFIDCLIVLIIVVSAGYAAWRGFIWETLTIFAWAAAAFSCLYFGPYIIPLAKSLVNTDWIAGLLAYSAVFLAVFIPFAFMSHRFSQSVKNSPIGPLDRAAGVAFGVVRGLVIVGLAYLAFTYFVPIRQQPNWISEAKLLPIVQDTADLLLSVVPNQPHDYAYVPQHEEIRQAPPPAEQKVEQKREQNARNQPASAPLKHELRHDPMAELIRKAEKPPKTEPKAETVQQKSAAAPQKSYGASDRQALDRLVQTGGSR
ncbi:MAG TPA: CvpA family protein [Rhizomicrobium sp.]|nr:CvpA family protein [Rhizomicrobium sp.]